jgi:hypothetical protein
MAALTDEVIKSLNPQQKQNLKKLFELAEKEKQVYEKAQRLFEKGAYSEDRGFSITPCEDWDDFHVINMSKPPEKQHPIYRERNEVKKQIRETLGESLKLGLGHLGLIQRQCKNYQVNM